MLIGTQQLIVFPVLSRIVDVNSFSTTVLFMTISTVIVNVIGGEASNTSLLRARVYSDNRLPWDSGRIILYGSAFLVIGSVIVLLMTAGETSFIIQGLIVTIFGMFRTFAVAPDKSVNKFHLVVIVHALYVIGALVGLCFVAQSNLPLLPFIVAEVAASLCVIIIRFANREVTLTLSRTPEYPATRKKFIYLAAVALLVNLVSYLDRLLIVPLLGAGALAIYYAASALAKVLSMITNPVANTLLSRLGSLEETRAGELFRQVIRIGITAFPILICMSLALTFLGLKFLYPDFFYEATVLILPVSIVAAFGSVSDLVRPFVMRFVSSRRFLIFNVIYAIVFLMGILIFSNLWGITGFAWANALAHGVLAILYFTQAALIARQPR